MSWLCTQPGSTWDVFAYTHTTASSTMILLFFFVHVGCGGNQEPTRQNPIQDRTHKTVATLTHSTKSPNRSRRVRPTLRSSPTKRQHTRNATKRCPSVVYIGVFHAFLFLGHFFRRGVLNESRCMYQAYCCCSGLGRCTTATPPPPPTTTKTCIHGTVVLS